MPDDVLLHDVAAGLYAAAALAAVIAAAAMRGFRTALAILAAALGVHTLAIAMRWGRLDHGPYVDLFEVLSSNVWSLHVAVFATALLLPRLRPMLAAALPLLQVMVLWMLSLTPADTQAPVTYDTMWLAVHVWLGKAFLGCVIVAVAISLVVLYRRFVRPGAFLRMPTTAALDDVAYRFVLVAFAFEGLMLVAGAIWAQDAWGRYWAWDPLETWAFLTWVAVAMFLHLRSTRRPSPAASAAMIVGIFALAFGTLFGMPFVSTAPHQGAV